MEGFGELVIRVLMRLGVDVMRLVQSHHTQFHVHGGFRILPHSPLTPRADSLILVTSRLSVAGNGGRCQRDRGMGGSGGHGVG